MTPKRDVCDVIKFYSYLGTIHISADAPEGGVSSPRCHKGGGLAKVSADMCK